MTVRKVPTKPSSNARDRRFREGPLSFNAIEERNQWMSSFLVNRHPGRRGDPRQPLEGPLTHRQTVANGPPDRVVW